MKVDLFDYPLDPELIAQQPAKERDKSRMLVVSREAGQFTDSFFWRLPEWLSTGDVIVLNNSQVLPARLIGMKRATGGRCELLLVQQISDVIWKCLTSPARSMRKGTQLDFGGVLQAEVIETLEDGLKAVRFAFEGNLRAVIEKLGLPPLPPYIKRPHGTVLDEDRERYQTIFAKREGSIAAPTAGLHFSKCVLDSLQIRGLEVIEITHHVGLATFQPVRTTDVEDHRLGEEWFEITREAASRLNTAKTQGRRIVAVGTTVTRALESATTPDGAIIQGSRRSSLFIYPGYQFKTVSALLTNFHLPKSTLLMLACAFASRDLILATYSHAAAKRYRFYSYGDCMLLL